MHLDARRLLKDSPKLEVTHVLARYRWQARLVEQGYSNKQLAEITRVLNVITACRTSKLGSLLFTWRSCQRTMLGLVQTGGIWQATATLPAGTTAWFINAHADGCRISSTFKETI